MTRPMVMCCGQDRSTNFCADCGNDLFDGRGIMGLLAHVSSTAKKHTKAMDNCLREDQASKRDITPNGLKYRDKKRLIVEQWQSWEAALRELLDEDTDD